MSDFVIDEFHAKHESSVSRIQDLATHELRTKYIPRKARENRKSSKGAVLVALKDDSVIGIAEYLQSDGFLYIQGIAVHPDHRGKGVCRSILHKAEEIATSRNLSGLSLCTIEETGNVEIFERLGFKVISRVIATNYVSPSGEPVIQVNMERKIA